MKKLKTLLTRFLAAAAMLAAMFCTTMSAMPVHAAEGLTMSTTYPGIAVSAGDSLSFSLDFDNETGEDADVSLSIKDCPEGWEGTFLGNSKEITDVYLKSGEQTSAATYSVKVPQDAQQGSYKTVLKAEANGSVSTLTLTMNVGENIIGDSSFTTEYAEQEGTVGTSFSFTSTLQNNSTEAQTYNFVVNAPDGWTVKITPDGDSTQVASLEVEGMSSSVVDITVTPAEAVTAGEYSIPISAVSATENLSTELQVTITGSYGMSLTAANSMLSFDATANQKSTVTLELTNTGNIDLENVNLSTSAPTDWTVEYSESTIDLLEAGATKEITMYVTPSDDALSGDYELDVTAKNNVCTESAAYRVTVKTSTVWGFVGVALIAAVAACLIAVFHKFGRH